MTCACSPWVPVSNVMDPVQSAMTCTWVPGYNVKDTVVYNDMCACTTWVPVNNVKDTAICTTICVSGLHNITGLDNKGLL